MSGFLTPPTFRPPATNIPLGSAGQVLTMVGAVPRFASGGGGGGGVGTYSKITPAAGSHDNVALAAGVGRLDVDSTAGNVTFTGISSAAAVDGQLLIVANIGANLLILRQLNASSTAADQLRIGADNFTITQWGSILLCYYAGSVNKWCQS